MRTSPLHDFFADAGAQFAERHGVEIVDRISDPEKEYRLVRDSVALSDASYMQVFRIPEEEAIDALDPLLAGNVARIRFGRMLHTFLADEEGHLAADCYVANNDEEFLLICESLVDDAAIRKQMMDAGGASANMEDLTETHALLSLDGYKAWAVAREVFGSDILGLPYLSVETCSFEDETVRLFRAGKTSEFGYLVLVSREKAAALAATLAEAVARQEGGLCGVSIHNDLRLEGRFFNVYAEGAAVRDPLALGIQWMIDFEKPDYCGGAAIRQRREAGVNQKIMGILASPGEELPSDASLLEGGETVGHMVASCVSHVLGCRMGLALVDVNRAYVGVTFALGQSDGPSVTTISMPPIMPKSLSVKLDEV